MSLIGFIKPKIKEQNIMLYFAINMTTLEINEKLANYFNFKNTLNISSFEIGHDLQTKTCFMELALLIKQNRGKTLQILNNWSFVWFQLWHSLITDKNTNRGRSPAKIDQRIELIYKKLKKILIIIFFKKTQKLILFLKQKIKEDKYKRFSFFIKTMNFKILNTFHFFGAFFSLFVFLQKIIYFMGSQKSFFYKKQHFFYNFFNHLTIHKVFLKKQAIFAKLQSIFYKMPRNVVNSQFYNLVIKQFNFTTPFFHKKNKKYYQTFGFLKKFLHTFLFVKNILFCDFNNLNKKQFWLCLRKILQIYDKKEIFPLTTKAKNFFIDFFYFGLRKQRFYKTWLRCAKKKNKTKLWYKHNINGILFKVRKPQVTYLKYIFNKTMQAIKQGFNQHAFFIVTNHFFTKIKKIVFKIASFVTFFLFNILWKRAKKQHTQISNKFLLNKFCIFIQKLARLYFFEKSKLKT